MSFILWLLWLSRLVIVGILLAGLIWTWQQILQKDPRMVYFLCMAALPFLFILLLCAGKWGAALANVLGVSVLAFFAWSILDLVIWNLDPATAKSEWHYLMAQEMKANAMLWGGVGLLIFLVWVLSLVVEGWRFRRACRQHEFLRVLWEVVQGQRYE